MSKCQNSQNSLKHIIHLLNILGLLSVERISLNKAKNFKFSWVSKKTLFSILLIIAGFIQVFIFIFNGVHKLLLSKIGKLIVHCLQW